MSLRVLGGLLLGLVLALAHGCGASQTDSREPQTAKEKQLREARDSGELDKPNTKWSGWRYRGDRNACFFVVGRRCFKTAKAACAATPCKTGCETIGGGPATVTCAATAARSKK